MNLISGMIGALLTLFGIYIAQRNGLLLFAVAKKEHDLNLRKTAPIMGSFVKLDTRQVLGSGYRPFHFIVTSVHNYGDLAAQQLSGYWRLYSPSASIRECMIPIRIDALGASPPYQTEQQLFGPNIDEMLQTGNPAIAFNVDIELDYLGLLPNKPQHYSARYQYDSVNRQVIQVGR